MTKPTKWVCSQRRLRSAWASAGSLIRVFAVRMKKPWVLSYPLSAQRRLIRLSGCPGWSESSLGAQPHCWFCHVAAQLERDGFGEVTAKQNIQCTTTHVQNRIYNVPQLMYITEYTMHHNSCTKQNIQCTTTHVQNRIYNVPQLMYKTEYTMYHNSCTKQNIQCTTTHVQNRIYNVPQLMYKTKYTMYHNSCTTLDRSYEVIMWPFSDNCQLLFVC